MVKKVSNVELEMLSGEKKDITLIKGIPDVQEGVESDKLILVEGIPGEVISMADIEFLTPNEAMGDSLVSYNALELDNILYYIKGEIDPEETKAIKSILVNPFASGGNKGFGITGMAIFSSLSSVNNPMLVVQIALIVILLIVYVFYEFELLMKIRQKDVFHKMNPATYLNKFINKDMRELHKLMRKASKEINDEMLDDAEGTYQEMMEIYNNKLSSELRGKAVQKTDKLYNELLVSRIFKVARDIKELAGQDKKGEARMVYNDMQQFYSQLPQSWKGRVSAKCKEVFELLAK
jgi:hypothetical protein